MTDWDYGVDILVRDPHGRPVMAVDAKGRPLPEDVLQGDDWRRLLDARERLGTPYALLFSPGKAFLIAPDGGVLAFDGAEILGVYDIHEVPRFQPRPIVETALYTWLVDLTMGIDRPSPVGFPRLYGDDVRRAA